MALVLRRPVTVALVLAAACSPGAGPATSTTVEAAATTTSLATTTIDTGDLGGVTMVTVEVDGAPLRVAQASTSDDRAQGLSGVDDLGELDGMLFTWGGETVTSAFTMRDTLIDLDIAFFDADGRFVDGFAMVRCEVSPCPSYAASGPYAYALETPAGSLATLGPGSVIVFP
jgi:uncharacterized membrane protein (UPF0127 family)